MFCCALCTTFLVYFVIVFKYVYKTLKKIAKKYFEFPINYMNAEVTRSMLICSIYFETYPQID